MKYEIAQTSKGKTEYIREIDGKPITDRKQALDFARGLIKTYPWRSYCLVPIIR